MEPNQDRERGGNLIQSLMHDLVILKENDTKSIDAFLRRTEMILRNLKLDKPHYTSILNSELKKTVRSGFDTSFSETRERVHNILLTAYEEYELFGKGGAAKGESKTKFSNRIFLVHGHDREMLASVRGVLAELDFKPIVLHDQPDQSRAVMEKFEDYSDVGFAVILMSPDDQGRDRDGSSGLKFRARQNVVFELGYFVGRLGRHRTLVIYRKVDNFDMPSDYQGILYKPFDDLGNWQFELVKELQAAGYSADANKLTKK